MAGMPLPRFVDSAECRTRAHCKTCRDRVWGEGFRRSVAGGDFDCPHVPWDFDPGAAEPSLLAKLAHGAAGLAKAAIGIEKAPNDVIAARAAACDACAHGAGRTLCGICGCLLAAKQRLASESCPLDPPRWGPAAVE